jgi:hypothetical protein
VRELLFGIIYQKAALIGLVSILRNIFGYGEHRESVEWCLGDEELEINAKTLFRSDFPHHHVKVACAATTGVSHWSILCDMTYDY